jgi:hypothetical protein
MASNLPTELQIEADAAWPRRASGPARPLPLDLLLRTTDTLVRLADVALEEGATALGGRGNGQRTLIATKQLEIDLLALRAAGGPAIDAARSLVDEPRELAFEIATGVRRALDEVSAALEGPACRESGEAAAGPVGMPTPARAA